MESNHDSHISKKRKTCTDSGDYSEATETQTINLKHDTDMWFNDGSVVLQAGLFQFRVHKAVLGRSSSIFRDMFSLPVSSPSTTDELVEGCEVVHLHDSAEDVRCMLSAIYDYEKIDLTKQILLRNLSALLRLGAKYDIPILRNNALQRLQKEFPTTLEDYDRVAHDSWQTFKPVGAGCLFDLINLAHNEGIVSILPQLYIHCISRSSWKGNPTLHYLFHGIEQEGGTVATLPPNVRCDILLGKEKLIEAIHQHPLQWLNRTYVCYNCATPDRCRLSCNDILISRLLPTPQLDFAFEPWAEIKSEANFCKACEREFERVHEAGRKKLWGLLPTLFGMPDWKELKKMDRW
ncbi:hypothetical protein CVT24_006627 [Panaeolus cyanescens]|uniref:BTB domain-containing protein n=1 Tax=Panaeolus cyanescens TaxID=181874 RepID=A0A409YSA9_9AGAR|nr:hypothetical protein CVT24_006627 [Panaeolus cyanescens]